MKLSIHALLVPLGWALLFAVQAAIFAMFAPLSAAAQGEQPLDPAAIVEEVRAIVAQRYVLPQRRPVIEQALAQALESGRYNVDDPAQLAPLIDADLQRAGQDKHLTLSFDPQGNAAMRSGEGGGFDMDAYARQARAANHGVAQMRVLPGNVRYLDYRGFDWVGEESGQAIDAAMRFLSAGEAAVIDLRRNGGGSPEAVQRMVSYFLDPGQPLVTFYMEGEAEPDVPHTLEDLSGQRMVGKPLYVLTSGATGSAAEEFAGHVAGYDIGELVGGHTAGAGFRSALQPIGSRFVLSVSIGRAVLASTSRDWEGEGHAPTIPAPVDMALPAAHRAALLQLSQQAGGARGDALRALADNVFATMEPRQSGHPLAAYAGSFGDRTIAVEGGCLVYQRAGRMDEPLVPLGEDRFAWLDDPSRVLSFEMSDGEAVALRLGTVVEPVRSRFEREQAR